MYAEPIVSERISIAEEELRYPLVYHSPSEVDAFSRKIDSLMKLDDSGNAYFPRDFEPDEWRFIENERALCMCDAAYWLTRYAYVSDETNTSVRFKFRGAQKIYFDVISTIEAQRAAIELLIAKGRQQYITTITELLAGHRVWFYNDTNCFVASADRDKSAEMARKAFFAYDHMPWWLKPKYSRRVEGIPGLMEFNTLDSRMTFVHGAGAARSKGAQKTGIARGTTPTVYHLSEVSAYPAPEQQIEAALFKSVHASPKVFGVLESTFAGDRGWFPDKFKFAMENYEKGFSRLCAIFFPWVCAREIFPTKTWWKTFSQHMPGGWTPEGRIAEQIAKAELYVQSTPLLAKHLGGNWIMPIEQQWFYNVGFREAEDSGTLPTWLQEMPCLTGDTRISTDLGIIRLDNADDAKSCESGSISQFIPKGSKPIWILKTKDGRQIRGTANHRFMTDAGWKELEKLNPGDVLHLIPPMFSDALDRATWEWLPVCEMGIDITPAFARFLGYYMGDGCFNSNTVEIAIDAQDADVQDDVYGLLSYIVGKPPIIQPIGKMIRLRSSSIRWFEILHALGGVRQIFDAEGAGNGWRRKVCVPECIFRSPKHVVREFLSALFECDGHATKRNPRVKLYSKHDGLLRDVQLLLLGFGIRSKLMALAVKHADGHIYTGRSLEIGAEFADLFYNDIQFISNRKQTTGKRRGKPKLVQRNNELIDIVASVEPTGISELVYDLSVPSSHQFSANGLQSHNCDPIEAMQSSFDNVFGREIIELHMSEREKKFDVYGMVGQAIDDQHEPTTDEIDYNRPRIVLNHQTPRGGIYRWELIPLRYDIYAPYATGIDRHGTRIDYGSDAVREAIDARLFVFEPPNPAMQYSIGADSATGYGSDASVFNVNRVGIPGTPDVQVAEFRSHNVNHVRLFAFILPAALFFREHRTDIESWPKFAVEQIASVGDVCQTELKLLGYPSSRMHHFGRYDEVKTKTLTNKLGWFTTGWSRPILLGRFVDAVKNGWYKMNSPITIEECRQFEVHSTEGGKQKLEHSSESWDDGIFASAISYFIVHDMDSLAERSKKQFQGVYKHELPPIDLTPNEPGWIVPTTGTSRPMSLDDLVHEERRFRFRL